MSDLLEITIFLTEEVKNLRVVGQPDLKDAAEKQQAVWNMVYRQASTLELNLTSLTSASLKRSIRWSSKRRTSSSRMSPECSMMLGSRQTRSTWTKSTRTSTFSESEKLSRLLLLKNEAFKHFLTLVKFIHCNSIPFHRLKRIQNEPGNLPPTKSRHEQTSVSSTCQNFIAFDILLRTTVKVYAACITSSKLWQPIL